MNGPFSEFLAAHPGPIGVAVSGGSDSTALLVLLHEAGADLRAVTVDHGLRPEAASEARAVARLCGQLGVPHETLRWQDRPEGNLQAAARAARYRLMTDWARARGIGVIALGHTLDDQAETFLMRLRRGSGVDGLSAMAEVTERAGLLWWRPLLDLRREELRAMLRARGIGWAEDPSNEDSRFERVRTRRALAALEELGLTPEALAETAARMRRARAALVEQTRALAEAAAEARAVGSVRLDVAALAAAPEEIRLRLLAHALMWVSGAEYRPRLEPLQALWRAAVGGRAATLSGCLAAPLDRGQVEIVREPATMERIVAPSAPGLYDGRWEVGAGAGEIRPLGEDGLALLPDWRTSAESRAALAASPSLWADGELRAAPFAGRQGDWTCRLKGGPETFIATLVPR